ncbi:MAG: hypothetical protein ABEH81_01255 [Halopenitus sp.]
MSAEKTVEHTISDGSVENLPDNLSKEEKTVAQMQAMKAASVDSEKLRLPVKEITANDNSVRFEIEHPVETNPTITLDKGGNWYNSELGEVLYWYDYRPSSMFQLQTDRIYIRKNDDDFSNWEICPPPEYNKPKREVVKYKIQRVKEDIPDAYWVWGVLPATIVVTNILSSAAGHNMSSEGDPIGNTMFIGLLFGAIALLIMVGITDIID